ncbi:MAG TPA: MAPEG family protein [Novosphingobium sp.]
MLLPTTLSMAAAAAILNLWLSIRIGRVRQSEKVSIGDGGSEPLIRRMRAQANFIENTPLTLILVGAIELAGKGGMWLAPVAGLFMLGRVVHAIGMDGGFKAGRGLGTLTSMLAQLGLAIVAVLASLNVL